MGNVYSAQNVASYLIYELNESKKIVNCKSIQRLLAAIEIKWQQAFGHTAFKEAFQENEKGFVIKEVYDTYVAHKDHHIELPATEIYLKYGTFQLVERTYAIPNFTYIEEKIVQEALAEYRYVQLTKAS